MRLVTAEEMRQEEQAANAAGLTYAMMMERAGRAVAQVAQEYVAAPPGKVLVLVGPGNNGGDGLVAAHYLHVWGHGVTVYIWRRNVAEDANLARLQQEGVPILWAGQDDEGRELARLTGEADLIVDALLGTGASGPLREDLRALLSTVKGALAPQHLETRAIRQSSTGPRPGHRPPPKVLAVDLPSGLNADTGEIDPGALPADLTITLAYPKRGLFLFPGAAYVGELMVADIGLAPGEAPEVLEVTTAQEVAAWLPPRPLQAHKGTFGKALIIAGSANYIGAPCLAAEAAYRVGAGLVTLAVGQAIHPVVASKISEATFLVLPDDLGALVPDALRVLARHLGQYNAVLVGPGLGREKATGEFLQALLRGREGSVTRPIGFAVPAQDPSPSFTLPPLVLDADGLNLLAEIPRWWELLPPHTILTPHPGEMARLLGRPVAEIEADRWNIARQAAQEWGCVVVLKGAFTVVASPAGQTTVIPFANPALATAGTGDVLAGAMVGLLAQGLAPHRAAICGAYLHGLAGELWRKQHGPRGLLAHELGALLPQACQALAP